MSLLLIYKKYPPLKKTPIATTTNKLFDFALFKIRSYRNISIIRLCFMYTWLTLLFTIPIFLQNTMGFSPIKTGALIFMMAISFAAFSPLIGHIMDKIGFRGPTTFAIILTIIACILLINYIFFPHIAILIIGLFIFGIASAIIGASTGAIIINSTPKHKLGLGMGMFYTNAFFGSILGATASSFLLNKISSLHLSHIIKLKKLTIKPLAYHHLTLIANSSRPISTIANYVVNKHQLKILHHSILTSAKLGELTAISASILLCIIAFILSFRLKTKL